VLVLAHDAKIEVVRTYGQVITSWRMDTSANDDSLYS